MMANNEERLKTLQSRFNKPLAAKKDNKNNTAKKDVERTRHSLYLDKALVARADQIYKDIAHELYPNEVNKSAFLEAMIATGLAHLDEIKALLTEINDV